MVRFRPAPLGRRFALIVAILFAALTLVASGPHHHGDADEASFFATACPSVNGPVRIGASGVDICTGHAFAAATVCPLCDWLATSSLPALLVTLAILPAAVVLLRAGSSYSAHRCSRPAPHRCLRAPPTLRGF